MYQSKSRRTFGKMLPAGIALTVLACAINSAFAADVTDLGAVGATDSTGAAATTDSASYQAPTQGSLSSTQPQSVINEQFIKNNLSGAANYTEIANIAPSVVNMSPNGVGASDSGRMSLRGFQDGQYNVTFDGIPFVDGADFTHHQNCYFMGQDTGEVVVDRGPGKASTIGDATFGGTIAVNSKNPGAKPALSPYVSMGSFNTRLAGVEFDTGVMQNYDDFSGFVDYKNYSTDGYLTNNFGTRSNLFAKFVKPVSENTAITFVSVQNTITQHASKGATTAQMAQNGPNFGLNQDPTSQAFVGYNWDTFSTNLEYVGVQTQQGDWKFDNKVYTYAYEHDGSKGTGTGKSPFGGTGMLGTTSLTQYRSYGDVFNATKTIGPSDLKFGMWIDQQKHQGGQKKVNLSLGTAIISTSLAERSSDTTLQPYVEYVWRPNTALTVTPGVKYYSFSRYYDASLDKGAGAPVNYSKTWSAVLPSLDVHYYLADKWSVYAQAAEGYLAPSLSTMQGTTNPALAVSNLIPSNTVNYQVGSTWISDKLTLSGDVYLINNNNLVQKGALVDNVQTYVNSGSAKIKGIESEATYVVGGGFSVYGNLSFSNSSIQIIDAPKNTAGAGLIYNNGAANSDGAFYSSLVAKEVGSRWSGANDAKGNVVNFAAYTETNFSAGYNFTKLTKLQLNANNIFNKTDPIIWAGGKDANNNLLFYTNVGRNFMLTLTTGL